MKRISFTTTDLAFAFAPALFSVVVVAEMTKHQYMPIRWMAAIAVFVVIMSIFLWICIAVKKRGRAESAYILRAYRQEAQKNKRIAGRLQALIANEHLTQSEREAVSEAIEALS